MHRWLLRILGALQIGGGFVGLALIVQTLEKSPGFLTIFMLITVFAVAYLMGIASGVGLLEGRAGSIEASMWFWAAQVLNFSSPLLTYQLWAGLASSLTLNFSSLGVGWSCHFGANFVLYFLRPGAPFSVGINVVACVALYLLNRLDRASQVGPDGHVELTVLPTIASVE